MDAQWIKLSAKAIDDWRIAKLALKFNIDYANALYACIRVWKRLYDRGGDVMDADEIDAAARIPNMASVMLDSHLAEALAAGIRIKGDEHAEAYARYVETQTEKGHASARARRIRVNVDRSQIRQQSEDVIQNTNPGSNHGSTAGQPGANPLRSQISDLSGVSSGSNPSALSTGNALLAEASTPPGDKASGEAEKGPTQAKAPKPPKKPPDPMAATVRLVGDYWTNLWASAQGEASYNWTQSEYLSLMPLVKKHGPGEVKARMFALIKSPPDGVKRLLAGSPPTVGLFVKCFNSLATWSNEKASAVKADPQDDLHRDDGWGRKAGLRYTELNALANRKVPSWWSVPERIAMAKDAHGEPMIPLVPPGVPKSHAFVLGKLAEYIVSSNGDRAAADQRNAADVDAWYRKRFGVKT